MKKIIVPLLAVGALLYFVAYDKLKTGLKVLFKGASFNKTESARTLYSQLFFNITLDAFNPTDIKSKINSIDIYVFFNNKVVGRILKNDGIILPQKTTATVKLLTSIPTLTIFNNVKDAVNVLAGGGHISLNFKGVVNTDFGSVNINQSAAVI